MTPKEKAIYLVNSFSKVGLQQRNEGIACALIAVKEIIKETKLQDKTIYQHGRTFYWQEVKQQIEKL